MRLTFSIILLAAVVATMVTSTTSAATMVYASPHNSGSVSDTSSTGSGSDASGSSSSGSTSGTGSSGSQSSGSGSTQSSSGSSGGKSSGISSSGPNPSGPPPSPLGPSQPLTTCPNGGQPDSSGKCPPSPPPPSPCPNGAQPDKNGKCPPPLPPRPCPGGAQPDKNGKCPPLPTGHTKDFGQGFSAGANDGKVGVYDPSAACAGASNQAHCIQGYKDAYVTACTHGKFGCGDGPTTCPPGESSKDCSVLTPTPPQNKCQEQHIAGVLPSTCPLPPPPIKCPQGSQLKHGECTPCKFNNGVNGSVTCTYTKRETIKTYVGSSGSSNYGGLRQIPSNDTDFPGNNPNAVSVHVIGAKKDIAGAYHVTGEITNIGTQTLNSVQITAHLLDAAGNLVGDATGFTSLPNIDPSHTATFDSLATPDQINGNPVSYRLSFDWSQNGTASPGHGEAENTGVVQSQVAPTKGTAAPNCIGIDNKGLRYVYVHCLYGGEIEQLCVKWPSLFANGSLAAQIPAGLNCSGMIPPSGMAGNQSNSSPITTTVNPTSNTTGPPVQKNTKSSANVNGVVNIPIDVNPFTQGWSVSNVIFYLNSTDGHYHLKGLLKNTLHETRNGFESILVSFEDKATNQTVDSESGSINTTLDPGATTQFDIPTSYTVKQENQFQFLGASITP